MIDLFRNKGAHVLVDGQFGSTGKGAFAAWLAWQNAEMSNSQWDGVVSNAGPNSGHTFYDRYGEKHVLKQLPTFAVASLVDHGIILPVFLSAGAIIDPEILDVEMRKYPDLPVAVHPNAAIITDAEREAEKTGTIAAVAGTRSGTGAALARKIHRAPDAVWQSMGNGVSRQFTKDSRLFVEVSQGFSLGINQRFYPKCTSRECTVSQALSDASLPPTAIARTYMTMRTYPIRVGNVDGHSSGDWYPDQREIEWDEIGVEPELTTVTKRPRRIATFSVPQFMDALKANDPDVVFLNFMNYVKREELPNFQKFMDTMGEQFGFDMIGGWGPKTEDIREW